MGSRISLQLLIAFAAIVFIGWFFSSLLIYLLLSLIFTSLFKPLSESLRHVSLLGIRIPKSVAILLSFALFGGLFYLFFLAFAPSIQAQFRVISSIRPAQLLTALSPAIHQFEHWLIDMNLLKKPVGYLYQLLSTNLTLELDQNSLGTLLGQLLQITSSFFIGALAVVFMTFFLLYDRGILKRLVLSIVPNAYFELSVSAFYKIEKLLNNYLLGLLLQTFAIFTLTSFGLTIIGFPFAFTVALVAALVNVVPYVGPLSGWLFSVVVGMGTLSAGPADNLYFWVLFKITAVALIVHLIDNVALQPIIFSRSVKAHPLEIFIAIFAGAALAGVIGMAIAIPVYTVLRVAVSELYSGYQKYHVFERSEK